jgi:hypothetical protein
VDIAEEEETHVEATEEARYAADTEEEEGKAFWKRATIAGPKKSSASTGSPTASGRNELKSSVNIFFFVWRKNYRKRKRIFLALFFRCPSLSVETLRLHRSNNISGHIIRQQVIILWRP